MEGEYPNNRDGRSRRRQQNVRRSSTDSHDMTFVTNNYQNLILDTSAIVQGSSGPLETNLGSVVEGNQNEIPTTTRVASSTYLQRLRPTARRRERIEQALKARNDVPVPLENTSMPVVNVPSTSSSTRAHHHGPSSPPPQQHSFPVYRSEGINLEVVLSFDVIHEDRPQANLMLNLGGTSNEEINRLESQINTPLSEEAILQGLNHRRHRLQAGEEQEICTICLDELDNGQELVKLDCGHSYHFECIRQWLAEKNCCPVCKNIALPY